MYGIIGRPLIARQCVFAAIAEKIDENNLKIEKTDEKILNITFARYGLQSVNYLDCSVFGERTI